MSNIIGDVTASILEYSSRSSVPEKYLSGLKGKEREKRAEEIVDRSQEARRAAGTDDKADDDRTNRPFKTDKGRKTRRSKYTVAFKRRFGESREPSNFSMSSTSLTWSLPKFLDSLGEWIDEQSRFQDKVAKGVKKAGGKDSVLSRIEEFAEEGEEQKAKNLLLKIGYMASDHRIEFTVTSKDPDGPITVAHVIPSSMSESKEKCDCGCEVCKKKGSERRYERGLREDVAILLAAREAYQEDQGCIVEVFGSDGLLIERFGAREDAENTFYQEMGITWNRFVMEYREELVEEHDVLLRACAVDLIENRLIVEGSSTGSKDKSSGGAVNKKLREISDKTGAPLPILRKVFNRGVAAWRTGHRPGATPTQWGYARVYSFTTGGKTAQTADKKLYQQWKS